MNNQGNNSKKRLEKIIEEHRRRKKEEKWRGTLEEYLLMVKNNPELADLAHTRVWKMIDKAASRVKNDEKTLNKYGRPVQEYDFYDDFYGVDIQIEALVETLKAAAMLLEASRQIIVLVGPVGGGKSSAITKLMKSLEGVEIYAIQGCQMQENPLHLLPESLREDKEKIKELLGLEFSIEEGDICPPCRFRLLEKDKLAKYYVDGDIKEGKIKEEYRKFFDEKGRPIWKKILKDQKFQYRDMDGRILYEKFLIEAVKLSRRDRKGLVTFPPIDPLSQDRSEWEGLEDISKLHEYPQGHPKLIKLIGCLNRSNRGVLEAREIFQSDDNEQFIPILTATQEKEIPAPGKHEMIHYDGLIICHTNSPHWEGFKSNPKNINYLDRIILIKWPRPLELDAEIKIYKKLIAKSKYKDIHFAPFALEIGGILALFSRYQESGYDLMTKLKIYTEGTATLSKGQKITASQLREEFPDEGMNEGFSSRFIDKNIIDRVAVRSKNNCIDPIAIFEMAIRAVKEADLPKDIKAKYLGWLQSDIIQEYKKFLAGEIIKHGRETFEEEMDKLFQAYRKNAEIFVKRKPEEEEPTEDQEILKLVEGVLGLYGMARESFRKDFVKFIRAKERKGEKVNWDSYPQMKEGLEKILVSSPEVLQMMLEKGEKQISENMVKKGNHCKHCVKIALEFAKNNLWRD